MLAACQEVPRPAAASGELDLRAWDFEASGPIALSGEWAFEWQRLGQGAPAAEERQFLTLPSAWNGRGPGGEERGAEGFATYRLKVLLPARPQRLALRVEEQSSAYRLLVNGHRVAGNGQVGRTRQATQGLYRTVIAPLAGDDGALELILEVANFHNLRGGATRPVLLGPIDAVLRAHDRLRMFDLALFGCFASLGGYHLALVALRRKERSFLLLGLLCMVIALRTVFEGVSGRPAIDLWPELSADWVERLLLVSLNAFVLLLTLFLAELFPRSGMRRLVRPTGALCLVLSAAAVLLPSPAVGHTALAMELWAVMLGVATSLMLVRASRRGTADASTVLCGFAFFLLFALRDVAIDTQLVSGPLLLPLGVLGLVVSFALVLSRRLTRSFASVEQLSDALGQSNQRLLLLDSRKDEFLATTAHELRTPVAGMVGIAESLVMPGAAPLPGEVAASLRLVVTTGRRLATLVNDLLDNARLRHGELRLERAPLDMRALAQATLDLLSPSAGNRRISLHNDIPAGLPPVHGDPARVQQILHNLIGNAVKFTQRGQVRVQAGLRACALETSITDTGIGIPPERLGAIFERYVSPGQTGGGAGLGLSITRELVELHGGELRVTSQPGVGSCFTFTLPAVEAGVLPVGAAAPTPLAPVLVEPARLPPGSPEPSARAQVLVVEDDPVIQHAICSQLRTADLTVVAAGDAEHALQLLHGGLEPDLVILDVTLPGISGYQLCRQLREHYPPHELPIIMLTARDSPEDLATGFGFGASDYLTKPFSRQELGARVQAQLAVHQGFWQLEENLRLESEVARGRRQTDTARQQALRYQLEPHFLFNALTSIRGAIAGEPSVARGMVSDLAEFCRRVLMDGEQDSRPLGREFELAELYLRMEKARWGDALRVELRLGPEAAVCEVPTLLLQPLIENSVKHGRRTSPQSLEVRVQAQLGAGGELELEVSNTGRWVTEEERAGDSTGTGLSNVRQRLSLFAPGRHAVAHRESEGWVTVQIRIEPALVRTG